MYKRPNSKQKEEDLIAEQAKFFGKTEIDDDHSFQSDEPENSGHFEDATVAANVTERDPPSSILNVFVDDHSLMKNVAFPSVVALSNTLSSIDENNQPVRRKSLFAERVMKRRQMKNENIGTKIKNVWGDKSVLIDGSGLGKVGTTLAAKQLHEENMKKLNDMSEDEILHEQKQLIDQLSTSEQGVKLLEFLRSWKEQKCTNRVYQSHTENNPELFISSNVNKSFERKTEDLPICYEEVKKYPHMDKIEAEKLAWIKNLPKTNSMNSAGFNARFDLNGSIVDRSNDIPTYMGLHHHGDEPEAAGYTLEELLHLSRSSVEQQRAFGLRTLANILLKAKDGRFDSCLSLPILSVLLDAGIIQLLRWALDDSCVSSVCAAVNALHAVLVNVPDEVALDRVFFWQFGYVFPYLPCTNESIKSENKIEEMNDASVVKLDVIKGIIRMDVLARFSYLLGNFSLMSTTVVCIMEILIRIARHSLESASLVARNTILMSIIINRYIPACKSVKGNNEAYACFPINQALKLVRVLVSCDRQFALTLFHNYKIMDSLLRYISIDFKHASAEERSLIIEAIRTWRVFLCYGIGLQQFLDFYPFFITLLHQLQGLSISGSAFFEFHLGSGLLCLLEGVLLCVPTVTLKNNSFVCNETPVPVIKWLHVCDTIELVSILLRNWLCGLTQDKEVTDAALNLVGSSFNFISTYFKIANDQIEIFPGTVMDKIEDLFSKAIFPFWNSNVCQKMLSHLSTFSNLIVDTHFESSRQSSSLPFLKAVLKNGMITSVIDVGSPIPFLSSYLDLVITCYRLHHGLKHELISMILCSREVVAYILSFSCTPLTDNFNWFYRFEQRFIYNVLLLTTFKVESAVEVAIFHRASCVLLNSVLAADEDIVLELLYIIFNHELFSILVEIDRETEDLLSSKLILPMATLQSPKIFSELTSSSLKDIPLILEMYRSICYKIISQPNLSRQCVYFRSSLGISTGANKVFSNGWIYLPLQYLCSQMERNKEPFPSTCSASDSVLQTVTLTLEWLHLISRTHPSLLDFPSTYNFLSTVFLLGSDLFLDPTIHSYLLEIILWLLCKWDNRQLKAPRGWDSFRNFYVQLIEQFEAVSYADQLFSLFVLFPLQQAFDVQLRIDLWSDHSNALRCFSIPISHVPFPMERFCFPIETDEKLIQCYIKTLSSGTVRPSNPLLYLIAIHHLHCYLFEIKQTSSTKEQIIRFINEMKNQNLKMHITHYDKSNPQALFKSNF